MYDNVSFLSHLHSDHFGDLDAFIVGSWLSGRYTPLHVYGGAGETPQLGTKAAKWSECRFSVGSQLRRRRRAPRELR